MSGISQDDIDAFADQSEPDIKAAIEYARRAKKGLPPDRWSDGVSGAKAVADGIAALVHVNAMLADAFQNLWNEKQEASRDSTRLHRADSKYSKDSGV